MVQLSHATAAAPPELQSAQLARLLSRLRHTILHPGPDRERLLRSSPFERARLSSNLEYARAILSKLEQDTAHLSGKGPAAARAGDAQAELLKRREELDQLLDRMEDLRQMAVADDDDASSADDDDHDDDNRDHALEHAILTPTGSVSRSTGVLSRDGESTDDGAATPASASLSLTNATASPVEPSSPHRLPPPHAALPTPPPPSPLPPPTQTSQTSQTLRSRRVPPSTAAASSATTAHTTARAALFATAGTTRTTTATTTTTTGPSSSTATAEAILDQHRAEQEALSESMVRMARRLKESTQSFSHTLQLDREVLARAGQAVDDTGRGMSSAGSRMGALARMTEGKGWWGRVILYGWVYGLMVVLLVVVFVLPKLRF